jgi:heavy metal sensor kinase
MKSIRLSLVVYFLVLLGAALGAVSWFVYGSSRQMLRASEESKTRLLNSEYEKRVKDAEQSLDEQLLQYAETLAVRSRWSHEHFEALAPLLVLGSALQPLQTLRVVGERGGDRQLFFQVRRIILAEFELADDVLPPAQGGQALYFFQVSGQVRGFDVRVVDRSPALADVRLPLKGMVGGNDAFKDRYESVTLPTGLRLRMVTVRRRVPQRSVLPDPIRLEVRPFGKGQPGGPRREANFPPPGGGGRPTYIQVAVNTAQHEAKLAGYRDDLDNGLARVVEDSDTTLASLRTRLLWISGISFLAVALGSFWLVRLGLAPLERVSEAVGRVSEKNFRLQVDDARLPRELQPIVGGLRRTLGLLQRAFQREKQAAADISHELRTPLAALLTTLDVGLRKPRSAEEYREMLQECRSAGQQMNQIIERLLALARLDAGVDNLRPRDVDATALAEECAALVRPLAEARDVSLRVQSKGPAPLRTDPEKLREILTNLLHNAIQYNRPHGAIEVAVERDNGAVNLDVQDTGIGIAPEAKAQIFERFYRADPSRHADDLHAGLGLAIVKGYVDLMGGSIAVDSTVGQGSRFRVRLPAEPDKTTG